MSSGGVGITYNDGENFLGVSWTNLKLLQNPGAQGEENMTR